MSATDELELTRVIRTVFSGDDGKRALAIIADAAEFYRPLPPNATSEQLHFHNGKRSLFFEAIYQHLQLTETEIAALESAARDEALRELMASN